MTGPRGAPPKHRSATEGERLRGKSQAMLKAMRCGGTYAIAPERPPLGLVPSLTILDPPTPSPLCSLPRQLTSAVIFRQRRECLVHRSAEPLSERTEACG